jgi:hypothetical protein
VRDIEKLVNESIVENCAVSWTELPYAEVRGRGDIMQFFGDKYGRRYGSFKLGAIMGSSTAIPWNSVPGPTHVRPAKSASSESRRRAPLPQACAVLKRWPD